MQYKTVRLFYGNGFDETIERYIKDGWAVFNIWTFKGAGNGPGTDANVQSMQTIITFIKNESLLQSL